MSISILYLIMLCGFFFTAIFWKKDNDKLNFIENIAIVIMIIFCWNAFTAGVIQIFKIKISLITLSISYIIPICFFIYECVKKGKQVIYFSLWDILPIVLGGIILFMYVRGYFGLDLHLHFITSDAARHMALDLSTYNTGAVATNMYYHSLNDAIAMWLLDSFISTVMGQAKVFVLMELVDLSLFGIIFYSIIRPLMNTKLDYILGNILTLMYVAGYPLYVVQFGFSYYGSAIILVEFIILVTIKYVQNRKLNWIILLNLSLFSLFVCYTYLIPVVYLSVFIAVLWRYLKFNKIDIIKTALDEVKIFIVPCILGLYYSYGNLSELTSSSTKAAGITNEGGSYFDLFSNFIWLLPVAVVGVHLCLQKKNRNYVISSFVIMNVLFTFVTFIFCMKGKMSAYYYYKEYNVLWLLAFLSFYYGYIELKKQRLDLIVVSIAIPIVFIIMGLGKVEEKITAHNPVIMNISADNFVNIYAFNLNYYRNFPDFNSFYIELMNYANENIPEDTKLAIGDEVTNAWFLTLTNSEYSFAYGTSEELQAYINEKDPEYICVFYNYQYDLNKEYIDSLGECVYSNEGGLIIKVD